MASSKKYKVDPRLIASIVIVESGANPFAVSGADSIGIMQIHLGTWGELADKQNVNLFKIEDNVDFGVRILRDYIADTDLWEGVARYRGKTDDPESQQGALEYVEKVQGIYEAVQTKISTRILANNSFKLRLPRSNRVSYVPIQRIRFLESSNSNPYNDPMTLSESPAAAGKRVTLII